MASNISLWECHPTIPTSSGAAGSIIAYAVNPVGFTLEWLVTRPIHFLVSQPQLERVFGHVPHEDPYGNYTPYGRGDLWYPGGDTMTD